MSDIFISQKCREIMELEKNVNKNHINLWQISFCKFIFSRIKWSYKCHIMSRCKRKKVITEKKNFLTKDLVLKNFIMVCDA